MEAGSEVTNPQRPIHSRDSGRRTGNGGVRPWGRYEAGRRGRGVGGVAEESAFAGDIERGVRVWKTAGAVAAAVNPTIRQPPDQRLPDRAIDAFDRACAAVRIRTLRPDSARRGRPARGGRNWPRRRPSTATSPTTRWSGSTPRTRHCP
ncbi:hypothetical protein [Streptomyces sp. Qhu_M48]|uniref:hypothetical protein n=1 Tax=Streptomyces sp. Qhu_M48 TaxID=3435889 RepID=UPI003F4FB089